MSAAADPVQVPQATQAVWVERLLWVFALSFALDYRAATSRADAGGMGLDQLFFVALACASTMGILLLGWRTLLTRPGVWLIGGWGAFLGFMLMNAFAQGVDPGRSLRVIFPLFLNFAGMINAHIAGCLGVRPGRIVGPIAIAACTNVVWRIFHGFAFKGVTLDTARVEVLSSANNWIAAFIGASLLLRRPLHASVFVAGAILFGGIIVTVTRALLFPVAMSALTSSICLFLLVKWRAVSLPDALKRYLPSFAIGGAAIAAILLVVAIQPVLIERWNERLFHHASDRNIAKDISWLTREAEASAIFQILSEEPVHYIFGKGIGNTYYWDQHYVPEFYLVYPEGEDLGTEVWYAGHSIWTYSLFSGGLIGLCTYLSLFTYIVISSLRAARANASEPGPDIWMAFLPFIAVCCLLSESMTSNPLDERLASLICGLMAGLPQAFFVRASWIHAAASTAIGYEEESPVGEAADIQHARSL